MVWHPTAAAHSCSRSQLQPLTAAAAHTFYRSQLLPLVARAVAADSVAQHSGGDRRPDCGPPLRHSVLPGRRLTVWPDSPATADSRAVAADYYFRFAPPPFLKAYLVSASFIWPYSLYCMALCVLYMEHDV